MTHPKANQIFLATVMCGLAAVSPALASSAGAPRVPLAFVENRGQLSSNVRFLASGPEFKAWFEDRGVVLERGRSQVRISFDGAPNTQRQAAIVPANPIGAHANFLYGNDPGKWQTGLPMFGTIRYVGAWPGIDLTYRIENGKLKAEYLVSPQANVDEIHLRFDREAVIQGDGTLRATGTAGDLVEDKPFLFQSIGGAKHEIAGHFHKFADGSIGFEAGPYNHAEALVIDPTIAFSGYFGGSSQDDITAIAIDAANNIVTVGYTSSNDLPASHGARTKYTGSVDAFVASFLPNGGGLNYCTYLGGTGDDRAFALALDSARNVYLTGWTSSTNFPLLGAIQTHLGGTRDAFVTKINAAGDTLVYSTYVGGSGVDVGYGIGLNASNAAIITGDTTSTNLPVTSKTFQARFGGVQDAFVAILSPAGNALTTMSYLGGSASEHASAIKVGPSGGFYVAGNTLSTNFPVVYAWQAKSGGGQDGFVTKFGADGTVLFFSTYLGGSGGTVGAPESVNAITLDAQSNIIVAGTTSSSNFPVTAGAYQTTASGQTDGFIARFSNPGALIQATLIGGSGSDGINALAVDFHGNPYVAGATSSLDFPVQRPLQNSNAGLMDAFVLKLNPTLTTLIFGTYLGGSGSDGANAIAVDAETSVVVAGQTSSADLTVSGSLQSARPGMLSAFITKIAPSFTLGVGYAYQGQMAFTADPWHTMSYTSSTLYGTATDIPIAGDWTGSGVKGIGVFRNGTWILDTNGNGVLDAADQTVVFGQAGDKPVVGDWRGTGRVALGLFRNGTFILDMSGHLSGTPTGLQDATFVFGQGGDVPVAADWNGSGTTKVGIFRNGLWLLDSNGDRAYTSADRSYTYGVAGDVPVVGDWDSSGTPNKIGVYRAGIWLLDYDGDGVLTTAGKTEMSLGFGFSGYSPLVF